MKMNIMDKKALYTFGCPIHKATIARLQLSPPTPPPESCSAILQPN